MFRYIVLPIIVLILGIFTTSAFAHKDIGYAPGMTKSVIETGHYTRK